MGGHFINFRVGCCVLPLLDTLAFIVKIYRPKQWMPLLMLKWITKSSILLSVPSKARSYVLRNDDEHKTFPLADLQLGGLHSNSVDLGNVS